VKTKSEVRYKFSAMVELSELPAAPETHSLSGSPSQSRLTKPDQKFGEYYDHSLIT